MTTPTFPEGYVPGVIYDNGDGTGKDLYPPREPPIAAEALTTSLNPEVFCDKFSSALINEG